MSARNPAIETPFQTGKCGQMTNETEKKTNPIRPTTQDAVRLAKTLIRHARFGALAFTDPATGSPGVSRVAAAPDRTGAPVILISHLSAHTKALSNNPRCSILLGEPGKGDPLAHPRISVFCTARFLSREDLETENAAARFLRRNPKSSLYAGFADFTYVRLEPVSASLNGGFGQAFNLTGNELLSPPIGTQPGMFDEDKTLARLNGDMRTLITRLMDLETGKTPAEFKVESIDSEGLDITAASRFQRIWFRNTVATQDKLFDYLLNSGKNP
jgi:heme iron utilization protein